MVQQDQVRGHPVITGGIKRTLEKKLTIKLGSLVLFLFLLDYGLFGFGLSWTAESFSGFFNKLRVTVFVVTIIVSLLVINRGLRESNKKIQISISQLILVTIVTASAFVARKAMYSTSISGDELAYLSNSSYHIIKITSLINGLGLSNTENSLFGSLPLQQLAFLGLIVLFSGWLLIYRVLKIRAKFRIAALLLIFISLRLSNDYFFHFSFQYMSGYTIPFVPISAISSDDLVYRIINTFVFFLVVTVGLGSLSRLNQAARLLGASLALLLFDFFGNFIPILETTMFFVCFGTVVLYRLIYLDHFSVESTLWIAVISVHFRPTNIIWVTLCVSILLINHRKQVRKMIEYLPQIGLVAPFVVDSIFRSAVIARGNVYSEDDNQYFGAGNEYVLMARSILQSFSKLEILFFVVLFVVLIFRKNFRVPIFLYILLVLVIYIPMIPKSTVGQFKYNYELVIPLFFVMALLISRHFALSNLRSVLLVVSILTISFISNVNNPNEDFVFRMLNLKNVQSPGFIAAPSVQKMSLQSQQEITGEEYCFNPSPLYGDAYYLLRNETNFQREQRRKFESSLVYPPDSGDFLRINQQINCLVIDSEPTKQKYHKYTTGWHKIYTASDPNFNSVFEVWLKPRKGETGGS